MAAELVVLGAGSALPRAGYGPAGYALRPAPGEPVTLLDCGPGSIRSLGGVGLAVPEVRRLVLSHFHTDHCLDLFALLFARRSPFLEGVETLELIGPVGTRAFLQEGAAALKGHPADRQVEVTEVSLDGRGRAELRAGDLELACAATGHTATSLAWRVGTAAGASLCYTGDTPFEPAVAELARGVDLFVCECSFPDELAVAGHLTPDSAGRLAAAARCRRLLLSHFYPEMEPEAARAGAARHYDGPIELARDGSRHALGA